MKKQLFWKLRAAMLFLLLCLTVTGRAEVTGTYDSSTKTLTFTGSGEITKSYVRGITGYDQATTLVIGSDVTSIGDEAFTYCDNLKDITLEYSDNQLAIGYRAFRGVKYETFHWNRNFTYGGNGYGNDIYNLLFSYKTSLQEVTIGNNITSIPANFFIDCSGLTNVEIPNTVTSIGENAFSGCSSLLSVTIPNGVERIEGHTFQECSSLTKIEIPNTVTYIGASAFLGCTGLTEITIPSSVTRIDNSAFFLCDGIKKITIAESPAELSISGSAFSGVHFETFYWGRKLAFGISDDISIFCGIRSLKTVTISNNVTSISKDCFEGCSNLTKVDIPNTVTSIGRAAFSDCSSLQSVTIPSGVKSIESQTFYGCSSLTDITIPNSISSIDHSAFYGCTGLTELTIPASVKNIEVWAFSGCKNIKKVTIADSPTELHIDGNALEAVPIETFYWGRKFTYADDSEARFFSDRSRLKTLTIGSKVTSIPDNCFKGCTNLNTVTINSNSVTHVDYTEKKNLADIITNVVDLTIGEEVTTIGEYAFYESPYLENVTFKNSSTAYTETSFGNCPKLQYFGPSEIETGDLKSKFSFATKTLTIEPKTQDATVAMPDYEGRNVTPWKDYAAAVENLVIKGNITTIGSNAFKEYTALKSVKFETNSLTSIHSYAFNGCTNLEDFYFPTNLTEIQAFAFTGCTSLTSLKLDNTKLATIGDRAFAGCTGLTELVLPKTLNTFGDYAFSVCTGIEKVLAYNAYPTNLSTYGVFDASIKETATLYTKTENGNTPLFVSAGYFDSCLDITTGLSCGPRVTYTLENGVLHISSTIPTYTYNYTSPEETPWYNDRESITQVTFACSGNGKIRRIGKNLLSGLPNLTKVQFLDAGVEVIDANAFANCPQLSNITIPTTVKTIGEGAFSGTAITSVTIPDGISTVSASAFKGCASLATVTLPETVKVIGDRAFMGCSVLSTINFPAGLERIGVYSFSGCTALESIALPADYTVIDSYAFTGSGITSLTLSSSVLGILDHAFDGCTKLTEVITYGNSKLEKIEIMAFNECTALKTFLMPGRVKTIKAMAFADCALEEIELSNCLVELGESAFSRNQLTSVTVPESLTSLGSAFAENTLLTEVNLPSTLESLGTAAFYGCTSLQSIELPENLESIGESAFSGCANLNNVVIPDSITEISSQTFLNCTALTSVTLPQSLTSIGQSAFQGCYSLESIVIPENVATIGQKAFNGCYLQSVYAQPQTAPVLADENVFSGTAYSETSALKVYTINTDEYENADIWCRLNIVNPYSGNAGDYVTYDVKESDGHYILTLTANIVDGVTEYRIKECEQGQTPWWLMNAYEYIDKIDSIVINDGITAISDYSLTNLSGIKTVKIPASVTTIGTGAFAGWTSLREMYVDGLNLRESANLIADADVYANTIVYTSEPYNFKTAATWSAFAKGNILPYATGYCGKVYEISDFDNGEALKYIVKGHTLAIECNVSGQDWIKFEELGVSQVEMAGYYLNAPWGAYKDYITDIDLSGMGNTNNIGGYAFYDLTNVSSVVIPDDVKVIGEGAFYGCIRLTSVTLPDNLESIGDNAFYNCSNLASIVIPKGVIGDYAFAECDVLASVTLKEGVTAIGESAFETSELKEITIPASVTNIGQDAFSDATSLETIKVNWETPLVFNSENDSPFADWNVNNGKYDATLIVPYGYANAYESAATVWKYFHIQEEGVVNLVDGKPYTNTEDQTCRVLNYTRTFNNADSWQALYIPFGMNYSDWSENFEIARINDVHQWDNDEDGTIDETAVEIVLVKDNIQPNTPYLIKANEAGTQSIELANATVYAAEVTPFEVSSWNTNFTFTGTYEGVSGEDMFDNGYYALGGGHLRQAESADNDLSSYRWYMSVTDRNGTPQNLSMVKVVMRNDDGSLTDISELQLETCNQKPETIYNLSGQRVNKMTKGGVYIQNGKKIFVK